MRFPIGSASGPQYRKVASFKTLSEFREELLREGIQIGLSSDAVPGKVLSSPLSCCGRTPGNRWAILPMEGWDCTRDGLPSEYTRRRWLRFASSGAKLICGTEAAAVMHRGRSNPHQLLAAEHTLEALKSLCTEMRRVHRESSGTDKELLIGLQLTHSGRFSHPDDPGKALPSTAYAHPLLDEKCHCGKENVLTDREIGEIVQAFVRSAVIAQKAGFDFVDIKHAHGYLAHEFLSAVERKGPYGGSFENRTRFFREIASGIRKACPGLNLAMRLSLFDLIPFVKDEKNGRGVPMAWEGSYPFAFGGDGTGRGMDPDLREPAEFIRMAHREYGVDLICATAGTPYYSVHLQRPAYYAVSDGYLPPEHPLLNVARHIDAVKRIRELCPPEIRFVGSGYSCLQEYLPNAAEYSVAHGLTDFVGIGRMALPYPDICSDLLAGRSPDRRRICRTFGDCTNAPRAGIVSGCYPLDDFYRRLSSAEELKQLKIKAKGRIS